jgi:hypothetical protein
MASKWYYRMEDVNVGPLSSKELRAAVRSGEITKDMLLWKRGLTRWVRARRVSRLFKSVPKEVAPLVAEPFEFQSVSPVDREDVRMLRENRGSGLHGCLQCGSPMTEELGSRCKNCVGKRGVLQAGDGKQATVLQLLCVGLSGLEFLNQVAWCA